MILSEPVNTDNKVKCLKNNYKTSKLIANLIDEMLASHTKLQPTSQFIVLLILADFIVVWLIFVFWNI